MRQEQFERDNGSHWDRFGDLLKQLEKKKRVDSERIQSFPQEYRRMCKHLALARDRRYSAFLVDYLNTMVMRAHHLLYKHKPVGRNKLIRFLAWDFPRAVRAEGKLLWLAIALFYVPYLGTMLAIYLDPELIYSFMDPTQVMEFEAMYDPNIPYERDAETDFGMFGYYIANNIGIAFRTFGSGFFAGVGSIFIMAFNGLFIGAVSGHMLHAEYAHKFFTFIIAHGSVELNAIVLAGLAGLKVGFALVAPGNLTRSHALIKAGQTALPIVYGMTGMLFLAALVEAFWSPRDFPYSVKYAVGTLCWLATLAYFALVGRGHED